MGGPLAVDERVPDEQLAADLTVDPTELHQPVGGQRDAVQGDPLVGHHRRPLLGPVRLAVGAFREVVAEALGPLGPDRGVLPGPEAAGLHQLTGHDVRRVLPPQPAPGEDREPRAAGAEVLPGAARATPSVAARGAALALLQQADVGEQPGQQCLVDAICVGDVATPGGRAARGAQVDLQLTGHLAELGLEVLPLADPEVVEVLALAHPPEGAARQLSLLRPQVAPEVQPGEEVGRRVLEPGMELVGLCLLLQGALTGVLQRQRRGDHEDVAHAPETLGLEDHPPQPWVDRQSREAPAQAGQALPAVRRVRRRDQSAELLEQLDAGGHLAPVRRLHEREAGDVAQPERRHLEDDRGEVGPQDLRVGELGSALEVLLGVQPDRDAGLDPPAAAGALAGGGPADRLDRQPLHLGLHRVARDARDTGVDDVPDAGDRQRRLGDVRGEHDASGGLGVRGEHPVLLGGGEPGEERHDLEGATRVRLQVAEGVGGVPDLPLAREEHQHVPGALVRELADGVHDRLGLVADDDLALVVHVPVVGRARRDQGSVADLDGVHPSGDLDDRGRPSAVVGEVPGEPLRVDGRRRDDQLQVGAPRQQSSEIAEQEVDVEAPLVGLVDDDRVVASELAVALKLGEQDAVGHHLDPGVARRAIGEAHLVADLGAELRLQLRRQALGDRAGGDPSRLRVPDQSPATALSAAELEADLRQLRGLPRAGLAGDDHDLVIPDRRGDVVAPAADRQLGREGDVHNVGNSPSRSGPPPTEFCLVRGRRSGSGQANDTADPRGSQARHSNPTHRGRMTPFQRSRRLQAGLAGLGVLSTLGVALGLGQATHTHESAPSGHAGTSGNAGNGGSRSATQHARQQPSPVTPPSSSAPQATTSGS